MLWRLGERHAAAVECQAEPISKRPAPQLMMWRAGAACRQAGRRSQQQRQQQQAEGVRALNTRASLLFAGDMEACLL